jgi:hypothetical protein
VPRRSGCHQRGRKNPGGMSHNKFSKCYWCNSAALSTAIRPTQTTRQESSVSLSDYSRPMRTSTMSTIRMMPPIPIPPWP